MSFKKFSTAIKKNESLRKCLVHEEVIKPVSPKFSLPEIPLPPSLENGLRKSNLEMLYSHQVKALEYCRSGKNVVVVTPTASGKSLLYNLPVLEKLASDKQNRAIFIFPLKALEQDQATKIRKLISDCNLDLTVEIYDGDTPTSLRAKIRKNPPNIIITNPDMLHLSILSYHSSWEDLLRNLKYVIIDELHVYRGVFGSQILHVMRRLKRISNYYCAKPQFIAASATIAGAKELAENLIGQDFTLIDESGAPQCKKIFLFFNPQISYLTFALNLLVIALKSNLRTIVFTKSRRTTELLHMWMKSALPDVASQVSSYRAGFLPEERREIEGKLLDGSIKGVITTSALELGIDIGGLDVCILVGYPGTISSTWQRAGRVGRGDNPATICLIAGQDQLDQYFMTNPADFFRRSVEKAIIDPTNKFMLKSHLVCAAQEIPIVQSDPLWTSTLHKPYFAELEKTGKILLGAAGDRYFSSMKRPQRNVDIRTAGSKYTIEIKGGNSSLGSVSGRSVFAECHPGAIYLHRGRQYIVEDLDTTAKRIVVNTIRANFYTNPMFEKETEILKEIAEKKLRAGVVKLVRMKVTEQLVGYQRRKLKGQELLSQHELEYPPSSYETIGCAISIPKNISNEAAKMEIHFRGGIHGVEHALLALSPLYALCDRNDMGGYSQLAHPQLDGPAVFLYDGFPGGIGLSNRIFEIFPELVEKTYDLLSNCNCEIGCPSCIHSPKCGHGNIPLDKAAAILTLEVLSGKMELKEDLRSEKLKYPKSLERKKVKLREMKKTKTPALCAIPGSWPKGKTGVVFDLETQRSAEDVGGWGNIRQMGLAWAVIYRFPGDEWLEFDESGVEELIKTLSESDLVIGFNQIRFDYEVLRGYSGYDFRKLNSYDILTQITSVLGHRLKLDSVASGTLGARKSADGLQSLEWWKNGEVEKVAEYCRKDVEVTRDVFFHILEKGYLLFEKRGIGLVRIPLKFNPKRFGL